MQNTELVQIEETSKAACDTRFASLLRDEFVKRKKKNPAYSLTAFAKHLSVDQSLFSKILAGKKKISAKLATELLLRAGVSPEKLSQAVAANFTSLAEDQFELLSDWVPFAILELAKTKGFKAESKWIAERLALHAAEVSSALTRLEKFGYITFDADAKKIRLNRPNNDWSSGKHTSHARKKLQKRLTEMSLNAIDDHDFTQRDHGSLTLAINKKRLPEIRAKMNQFRMELGALLQEDAVLDEVFQITMSIFPVSNIQSGDRK